MKMITIRFPIWPWGYHVKKIKVAQTWNELSEKQLTRLAPLFYKSDLSSPAFRIMAVRILYGLKWWDMMRLGAERILSLYAFIRFLEGENNLTDNKVTKITTKGITLYGPMGGFETLLAKEWVDADQAFTDIIQGKNLEDLDKLMAILFREKQKGMSPAHPHWAKDLRQDYIDANIELRIRYVKKIPLATKLAVLIWYQGCRMEWEQVFERTFKGTAQDVEHFGWMETLQKLSGSTFGSLWDTENTHMYKLMLNMEVALKDEEIRKKKENIRKKNAY